MTHAASHLCQIIIYLCNIFYHSYKPVTVITHFKMQYEIIKQKNTLLLTCGYSLGVIGVYSSNLAIAAILRVINPYTKGESQITQTIR